jgi:hypothetical protein
MVFLQITGNTFNIKDELKAIRPINTKNFWKFNFDSKTWILQLGNNSYTKHFKDAITSFCKDHNLFFEESLVNRQDNYVTKSINDFNDSQSFFDYFHSTFGNSRKL